MTNNSVMLGTESNKNCFEFTISQETSLAIRNHDKSNKTVILAFSEAECVVHFYNDYRVIE